VLGAGVALGELAAGVPTFRHADLVVAGRRAAHPPRHATGEALRGVVHAPPAAQPQQLRVAQRPLLHHSHIGALALQARHLMNLVELKVVTL